MSYFGYVQLKLGQNGTRVGRYLKKWDILYGPSLAEFQSWWHKNKMTQETQRLAFLISVLCRVSRKKSHLWRNFATIELYIDLGKPRVNAEKATRLDKSCDPCMQLLYNKIKSHVEKLAIHAFTVHFFKAHFIYQTYANMYTMHQSMKIKNSRQILV